MPNQNKPASGKKDEPKGKTQGSKSKGSQSGGQSGAKSSGGAKKR